MKLINNTLLFFALLSAIACGPSAEQIKAQQKRIDDSTQAVNEARQKRKEMLSTKIKEYEEGLSTLSAQLAVEQDKLTGIKEFKLLRSKDEREQEIFDQTKVINEVKEAIESIRLSKDSLKEELQGLN